MNRSFSLIDLPSPKVFVLMVGVVFCLPNVPIIRHQIVPIGTISKTYPTIISSSRQLLFQQRFSRKLSCNTTTKMEELPTTATSVFEEKTTNIPVSLYTEENEETTTPNEVEEVTDLPEVTSELPQLTFLEVDIGIGDEVGMTTTESQLEWDEKDNEIDAIIVGNISDSIEDLIDGVEDKNVGEEEENEKVEHQNDNGTKDDNENALKDPFKNTTDASIENNLATEVNEMLENEPAKAPIHAQLDLPENILNSYASGFFQRFANSPFVSFQQIPVSSSSNPSNGLPLIKSYRPLLQTAAFTAALHPLPIFKKTTTTTTIEQHHHPQHFIHSHDGVALNYAPAGW